MTDSPNKVTVPDPMELARAVKVLGGTPSRYTPRGPSDSEAFVKAALATAAAGRALTTACAAQQALGSEGAEAELASLGPLLIAAIEEGDDRIDAVPLVWYWQVSRIAVALRNIREKAPAADPLIKACADTSRALMILLEARLNLRAEHTERLSALLGEAEEMLTSARSNTARLPHWIRQPGNLE
ncbi:hypothetical protein ACFYUL_19050 [Streptomyces sp. NPDC004311]|uniref:hypothetical protein n=1 Tax=Streptomyces sp. NPDC004311 TaxID=3364698 RepID=UPI0036D170B1